MKEILNYINNNAIVASLITLGLNALIQVLIKLSDRKYDEKKELRKERKRQFYNKAELHIEKKYNLKDKPDINLFLADFKVKTSDNEVEFYYDKNILDSSKYNHLRFYLKNIGKAGINQLDICSNDQRGLMLCEMNHLETLVTRKLIDYSYCYDRKIQKGETILVDIAYLKNSKIYKAIGSEISILFRDSYNNLYKQAFFVHDNNLYEPHRVSYETYRLYTTIDTAEECFKKPWLW